MQVKEKRAQLEKLRSTFARRASEYLRNYFDMMVEFMLNEKSFFSEVCSKFFGGFSLIYRSLDFLLTTN